MGDRALRSSGSGSGGGGIRPPPLGLGPKRFSRLFRFAAAVIALPLCATSGTNRPPYRIHAKAEALDIVPRWPSTCTLGSRSVITCCPVRGNYGVTV